MQTNPRAPPQHFHICGHRAAVYEAQGTRQRTLVDELRKTRAYPTSSPTAWSNPLLVRSSVSLQDSCSTTSQPGSFQSDTMAPKNMQSTLQMDLRMHMQWIEENLKTLQGREGVGLRGKLRQGKNIQERKIYQWLMRHETSIQLSPMLFGNSTSAGCAGKHLTSHGILARPQHASATTKLYPGSRKRDLNCHKSRTNAHIGTVELRTDMLHKRGLTVSLQHRVNPDPDRRLLNDRHPDA